MDERTPRREYLPKRFLDEIALHLVRNYSGKDIHAPLILAIEGEPGCGKTKQCDMALQELGVDSISIYGYELENPAAGRPAEIIRDRYLEAAKRNRKDEGAACVLVLHDIDTAIGLWGKSKENAIFQYTVNNQSVHVTLMSLADKPEVVDNLPCQRVPIIVTGNDLSLLHNPLTREGRTHIFRWEPTPEEKVGIVAALLVGSALNQRDAVDLVRSREKQSVAYFVQFISALYQRPIREAFTKHSHKEILSDVIKGGNLVNFHEDEIRRSFQILMASPI